METHEDATGVTTASESKKRCPSCGGLNPQRAEWCGQCLARFESPEETPKETPAEIPGDSPVAPADSSNGSVATDAEGPAEDSLPGRPVEARKLLNVTEDGITWTCVMCDNANALELSHCAVCGTPFNKVVKKPEVERPQRDPGTVAMFSLFFPGAGHAYMGLWGQAIARGILSTWVLGVVVMSLLQLEAPGAKAIVVLYAVAATVLWMIGAHDAYREANGQDRMVILQGRMFLFVVLGLLFMLVALLVMAGAGASGGA